MKILIVDDDPDIHRIASLALTRHGQHQVIAAASGEEGVAAAVRERPNVIVLDLNMPGMDGLATLAALQADPAATAIPVIMLSASFTSDEQQRLNGIGLAGLLRKPLRPAAMAEQIEEIVASRVPRA
ncbi:MAG TPA: response regulator [Thermoanaerobaculia bacterium]|nr:response regulator [Thermoanaerobaculia bacterium]